MAKEHTKIEDYAFLSDTQTGALVSRDGCVDWLCFPRFDSPACFASLVGDKENGHWRFFPAENIDQTRRRYRGETLILETEIETKSGAVRLIDFMPPRGENPDIIRIVEGLRGKVSMHMELIVRFDYGQIVPWVRKRHDGLEAVARRHVRFALAVAFRLSRGSQIQAGMAVAGCRWKPCTDAEHVRRSRRTPPRRT